MTLSSANGGLPAGGLPPSAFTTVDIILDVAANAPQGQDLVNWAEISADDGMDGDSTPDIDQTNDVFGGDNDTNNTGGDEDDHDPAEVTVATFDLALVKELAPGQSAMVTVGALVDFRIIVENQGSIAADNIEIVDYIPSCLSLADPDWTGTNPAFYTMSVAGGDLPAGGLLPGQTAFVDITLMVDAAATLGCDLVNFAEIASTTDDNGNPIPDMDSSPDSDPTNDTFGGDNITDNTGGDEDDHDQAEVTLDLMYDLALTKVFADFIDFNNSGDISQEDDVIFMITVFNQGMLDANNIEITDYIPAGMTLSPNDSNGWVGPSAGPVTNTVNFIPANGGSETLEIILRVDADFMGTELVNWAEISNDDGNDIDSTPDGIQFNGPGETDDLSDDGLTDNSNGDEDDHDPAQISVGQTFDLALMKSVVPGQSGPFDVFDDITYSIEVINQGTVDAFNVDLIDYVQPGQELSPNDVNGWSVDANGDYTNSIVGPIAPGSSQMVFITMRITPEVYVLQLDELSNVAEITSATDSNGVSQDDVDSVADTTIGNDNQMDDVTDNTGGDEDDEVLAFVELEHLDPTGFLYCDLTGRLVTGG